MNEIPKSEPKRFPLAECLLVTVDGTLEEAEYGLMCVLAINEIRWDFLGIPSIHD